MENKITIVSSDTYLEPEVIISIIEEKFGKSIDELKNDIKIKNIFITEEHVTKYLDDKLAEENPELKKRVENGGKSPKKTFGKMTKEDSQAEVQNFMDNLYMGRYSFSPYTLKYFHKYSDICRKKSISLLDIIKGIGTKDTESIQDTLNDLDIILDSDGNILAGDIERLIEPTIENIEDFNKKVDKANSLYTYLDFKINKDSIYGNGFCEDEVYPHEGLQLMSLYYNKVRGCVPLSERQRNDLRQRIAEAGKKFIKVVEDL